MTKRRLQNVHRRPRLILGRQLLKIIRCPIVDCDGTLRRTSDPYREHGDVEEGTFGLTKQLECAMCGLRFSLVIEDVARARQQSLLANRPEPIQPQSSPNERWEASKTLDRWNVALWEARELERLIYVRPGSSPDERRELQRETYRLRRERAVE